MGAPVFNFLLFVAGDAANSAAAIANLKALCCEHLPGRHEIEIVDVFVHPERALAEGVFLTPTLVKLSPAPTRKIVGSLNNTDTVLSAIGITPGDGS
jgi:circadian clock protein KaiB